MRTSAWRLKQVVLNDEDGTASRKSTVWMRMEKGGKMKGFFFFDLATYACALLQGDIFLPTNCSFLSEVDLFDFYFSCSKTHTYAPISKTPPRRVFGPSNNRRVTPTDDTR